VSGPGAITAVDGGQRITFDAGDPMNLNQFDAALNGTVDDLATLAPSRELGERVADPDD
jgi:hypothetical protein